MGIPYRSRLIMPRIKKNLGKSNKNEWINHENILEIGELWVKEEIKVTSKTLVRHNKHWRNEWGSIGFHMMVLTVIAMMVNVLVVIFHNSTYSRLVYVDWKVPIITSLFKKDGREKMEPWTTSLIIKREATGICIREVATGHLNNDHKIG